MATKLTGFSRLLIILAILAGVYFLVQRFVLPNMDSTETTTVTTENQTIELEDPSNPTSEAKNTNRVNSNASFNYSPPAPSNGQLKGVVELGASGFNSFIVMIDRAKNWSLEKVEWGNSMVYDGLASSSDITTGLKKYIQTILDFGVRGKDVHFVVSSGAQKVEATQKIINGLKSLGYVVNTVTPEQEGTYALQAAIPVAFRDRAFLLDIGSGNTKVSWMYGGDIIAKETYGSKYYLDNADDSSVKQQAKNLANQIPANLSRTCFMLGGVAFNLAKQHRNGKERYTVLKDPNSYNPDDAKTKAGVNILDGIVEGSNCEAIVFDWDANFTIGFLLGLPN